MRPNSYSDEENNMYKLHIYMYMMIQKTLFLILVVCVNDCVVNSLVTIKIPKGLHNNFQTPQT